MMMKQTLEQTMQMIDEAQVTGKPVVLTTMARHSHQGIVTEIEPGQVKPFAERSILHLETARGIKRVEVYAITKIKWAD
ncbi:hypothetical protein IV56_GL001353 [Lacticaseibacillus saniviri JCM 17471 = DSM 24301]|uniref:Uncharacterized protein n=2 Tax=Lacticaseibacillus saniviri TaxID=931533 RepID=A0A0R2MX61_9LACO|nr:hypothetical protein IV56_GL001353 [Lacticaseibacillus saniviri JCM 17471 = DSM 24301]